MHRVTVSSLLAPLIIGLQFYKRNIPSLHTAFSYYKFFFPQISADL